MNENYPTSADADITLLLEGTFPFVIGGVSSWVYHLITHFSQYRFAVIFLGGSRDDYGKPHYTFPKNLVHLETHYLFDNLESNPHEVQPAEKTFDDVVDMHQHFKSNSTAEFSALGEQLKDTLVCKKGISADDFLYSRLSWDFIIKNYEKKCPDITFVDYFWSIRNMHLPMWQLSNIVKNAPKTRVIHSVSTGYAGYLGSLMHHEYHYPFILTEHGIYVKERRIDLITQWVAIGNEFEQRSALTKQYLTDIWVSFFEVLARFCYAAADPIISLFSAYQQQQIQDGAEADRSIIIPNGVSFDEKIAPAKSSPSADKPVIALIGRVVPIKDIKNFIRSMVVIRERIPNAQAWIVGPMDEDKNYATECQDLVDVLFLRDHVHFKGMQKMNEVLPQVDLVALSSISEGLPLVILEGYAAGIPAVVTNVGACAELIYGKSEEDKALGASGIVVEIANAEALAQGIITLLQDTPRWQAAQRVARERVKRFYSEKQFLDSYQQIYDKALEQWQG